MALNRQAYTGGHFELDIDGHTSSAYLKGVDGGNWKSTPISEAIGPDNLKLNHRGLIEVEPFTIDVGLASCGDIMKWIQSSWKKKYTRRNGCVRHADFDLKTTFEHEFYSALITETTFPALDGSSKEAGYLKLKLHPEWVKTMPTPSGPKTVSGQTSQKQKMWLPSAFRFSIDGVADMEHTNKIESFTVKQAVKTHYIGNERYPRIEPTKIEFPSIVGTIALPKAGALWRWWDQHTSEVAKTDEELQRNGMIEFLDPKRGTTIFSIKLEKMELKSLALVASTANQEAIKRVKFELNVTDMELDNLSGLD